MFTKGNFVFKGISERKGGEFKNEKGQNIKFDPAYKIALDENVEGKIVDRTFNFPKSNEELFNKFNSLSTYDDIEITFEVLLYKSNVKLVPVNVELGE